MVGDGGDSVLFKQGELFRLEPGLLRIAVVYTVVLIPLIMVLGSIFLIVFQNFQEEIPAPSGCSMFGLHKETNIADEHHEKYAEESNESKGGNWRVKSLWIYPIKSCRGVELRNSNIIKTGLKYDRQFAFAQLISPFPVSASDSDSKKTDHKWKFITQREFPMLSQVKTELWIPDPRKPSYSKDLPDVQTKGVIIVTFPYQEDGWRGVLANLAAKIQGGIPEKSFSIPFSPTNEQIKRDYSLEEFTIWKDSPKSLNMGLLVPPELKYCLGVRNPLSLFRVFNERKVFRAAPRKEQLGWQPVTGFADAYPINILGIASMQDLSKRQPVGSSPLSVKRFRANIIISGTPAYAEDSWKRIRIGRYEYHVVCRCVRCKIPNVDSETGFKHKEQPYKTLVSQRQIDEGAPGLGCLGMQMVPVLQESEVKVGDSIEVLETGEHLYIKQ